jgi:serine phosphatase RsbU (regulator of sigma subunit)
MSKSWRNWLIVFAVSTAAWILLANLNAAGGLVALAAVVSVVSFLVLSVKAFAAVFRSVVRRLALRLAFSYFLIGIVPIPLLAALGFMVAYLVAHQFAANRVRREITAVGESAMVSGVQLPGVAAGPDGKIIASDVAWLPVGASAPWLEKLAHPGGFLVEGEDAWLAIPEGRERRARLLRLTDPNAPWLQELADRTGYEVDIEIGSARNDSEGFTVDTEAAKPSVSVKIGEPTPAPKRSRPDLTRRPSGPVPKGGGIGTSSWVHVFYLETALNAVAEKAKTGHNVVILMATTSPRTVTHQLFAQGVDEISGVFQIIFLVLCGILLAVYVIALSIAFVLAGSIARNVNRLTRATRAIARGDFSVRVASKSRDQIGDLARSFDGMAESIERLLVETAQKERLESEIAVARTIQHKLLPPPEAVLSGATVHAHFEPVAEIGGDYYDYLPMPDGRIAFALGDVSGHGLPTGLLVAMAKAGLSTLIEAGHERGDLFARMNELIHRSTDPRHYMTLALLAYDAKSRQGVLTNAGQLAPYRVSRAAVEAMSLPSFPLGLFPEKTFPSRPETFSAGDLVVFFSDGLIEAVDRDDEAFGFDRFEAVLREHAAAGAAALRDAILAAVVAHTGNRPSDDDRTLLILTLD